MNPASHANLPATRSTDPTVTTLADRQAALVAALVAGAPPPPGFAPRPLAATRTALLRKRAGEVARYWPLLATGLGPRWLEVFQQWAAGRPPAGALREGWDLARYLRGVGELPPLGADELACWQARYHDPEPGRPPRPRRLPSWGQAGGAVAIQFAGRVRLLRPARRRP
ncbi:hypothetical protein [Salinispora tropica]|uniref:SCO6045-like C-terminal domain-containing protein n=1 Tax=Salinispora tropica (strain ATCC BAA-916 / DSM 44818 / JCM 13857 / NBRC 105044 / CNB-440) TaxID=369723 RepID=A4X9D9_SALTO|nr:hypothetical protein [Salinispora tropica]ABP55506.1 hypothetical protein Strop_3069 [Salinispora tropica CNB-440]